MTIGCTSCIANHIIKPKVYPEIQKSYPKTSIRFLYFKHFTNFVGCQKKSQLKTVIILLLFLISISISGLSVINSDTNTIGKTVDKKYVKKIHHSLQDKESVDVLVEFYYPETNSSDIKISADKRIKYMEVNSSNIADIVRESNVKKIWPDLVTRSFINSSTEQIEAEYLWSLNHTGTGVKIAILDTGIADHEMFPGTIIEEDFTGDGIGDEHGHGTHVAGIAAGDGHYRGIAYNATLYIGKVLDDNGYGQLSWLIDGIDWAIENEVDVISLSLGAIYSGSPEAQLSSPEVQKVEEAIANDITVVVASGNCGGGCGSFSGVTTPGIAENAITVGAVDSLNNHAYFSSGDTISGYIKPDIVAPGFSVCSSIPGGYDCWSGTSMATPFVAGAAALLREYDESLSPWMIKQKMENSAHDLGAGGKDELYGSGLINLSSILHAQYEDSKKYFLTSSDMIVGKTGTVRMHYTNNESSNVSVSMVIEDVGSIVSHSETKWIDLNETEEFEMEFEPRVAGKYPLTIAIDDEIIEEHAYVSGNPDTMHAVRLVLK